MPEHSQSKIPGNLPDSPPALIIAADVADFAEKAATLLLEKLRLFERPLTVLPTGTTPLPVYEFLATHYGAEPLWQALRYLTLDEYAGLAENDPRLFKNWLSRTLLDPVGVPAQNRAVFQSNAPDPAAEAQRMQDWLAANGPIDVAVLGLGTNGHIGFNEPGSAFDSAARLVNLTPESIAVNRAYWPDQEVPHTAYTLGLGDLRTARHTILLVSGAHKADILAKTLNGPVGPDIPATYLRTIENVTIIADEAAAQT